MEYKLELPGAEIDRLLKLAGTFSHKNLLHNWDFRNPVNQRAGSSYTGAGTYTIDRFYANRLTVTIQTGYITLTGLALSIGTPYFAQKVEEIAQLNGKVVTITIRYRTTSDKWSHGYYDGTYHMDPIPASSVWSYYTRTFTIPTTSTVPFGIHCTQDTTDTIDIEMVKIEVGSISTLVNDPPADFEEQLALCKRYFEKSYSYQDAPGSNVGLSSGGIFDSMAYNSYKLCQSVVQYQVQKRANPIVTLYSPLGTADRIYAAGSGSDLSGVTTDFSNESSFSVQGNNHLVAGDYYKFHWTASADL